MRRRMIKMALVGIIGSFFVTACVDYLDVDTVGQLNEDEFYQTDEDALQALTAAYDYLSYENFYSWYLQKTLPSDESNASGASPGDQIALQDLDQFGWDSTNPAIDFVWKQYYGTINRANIVIEKVTPEN